jgi:hypothetical protein
MRDDSFNIARGDVKAERNTNIRAIACFKRILMRVVRFGRKKFLRTLPRVLSRFTGCFHLFTHIFHFPDGKWHFRFHPTFRPQYPFNVILTDPRHFHFHFIMRIAQHYKLYNKLCKRTNEPNQPAASLTLCLIKRTTQKPNAHTSGPISSRTHFTAEQKGPRIGSLRGASGAIYRLRHGTDLD